MKRVRIESAAPASPLRGHGLTPVANDDAAPEAECRALTVVSPVPARDAANDVPRRSAPFLTQLLATKAGVPQSRERRRAEPDVAVHAYEANMAPLPPLQGKVLSRAT
jgi:hypothetical protein